MSQARSIFELPIVSTGAIARGRLVSFAGGQITSTGVKALGVAKHDAPAAGHDVAVAVIGTAIAEAGAAITAGASLVADAQGRVVPTTTLAVAVGATPVTSTAANGSAILTGGDMPQFVVGDAMQAAAAAGAFIEILLRR